MNATRAKYAIVRPVPASYDRCVRTNVERIDVALAKRQHAEYCKTLQKLGLKLIWIEADNTLPDSCFVDFCDLIEWEKLFKEQITRRAIIVVSAYINDIFNP